MSILLDQSLFVILLVILLGVFCQRKQILNNEHIDGFEIFLFKVAMPFYLFIVTYQANLSTLFNVKFIYGYLAAFLVVSLAAFYASYNNCPKDELWMKIFASSYVNSAIYALPIIVILFKNPTSGVLANILQIVVIQTIFIVIFSSIKNRTKHIVARLFAVFSTPIIIMPILGLCCNAANLNIPSTIGEVIQKIGNTAPAIALFTFGAGLGTVQINKAIFTKELKTLLLIKNILHPLAAFVVGKYIFALESYWLLSLVIAASAPSALIVSIVAKQFNIIPGLMKRTVAISSYLSLITLLVIIMLFQTLHLIN